MVNLFWLIWSTDSHDSEIKINVKVASYKHFRLDLVSFKKISEIYIFIISIWCLLLIRDISLSSNYCNKILDFLSKFCWNKYLPSWIIGPTLFTPFLLTRGDGNGQFLVILLSLRCFICAQVLAGGSLLHLMMQ